MAKFRTILKNEGITDLSVLPEDARDFIKEYETLEKSKLKAVLKPDGTYTDNALKKLNRLDKTIVDYIAEYVAEKEEQEEAARKEESDRLAKEQADKEEADRIAKENADKAEAERLANEKEEKRKKKAFGGTFGWF